VKAPLEDAARALQFIRSKAKEWNLDKKRVGATGGSAGACSSLWLAFHDDLATRRATTRWRANDPLYCAAVAGAQDVARPQGAARVIPELPYGAHAFGLANFQALYDNRDQVLNGSRSILIEHVTKDDPPIFLEYGGQKTAAVVGEKQTDPTTRL